MTLGQTLLALRKSKQLSQEEVAEKLNVTRQTVSKWETDQSTPDFDKIRPICELFSISFDELLTGEKTTPLPSSEAAPQAFAQQDAVSQASAPQEARPSDEDVSRRQKRARNVGVGVMIYIFAVAWIMASIPVLHVHPVLSTAIFLVICGVATGLIVYSGIFYKQETPRRAPEEAPQDKKLRRLITQLLTTVALIVYLTVSFATMAWHITWIIWIVYVLLVEIVKLIFILRGDRDEK